MASIRTPIAAQTTLCAADDLDGAGTTLDISGRAAVLIAQVASGTAGTAGVDVAQVSKDGGLTWSNAIIRNAAGTAVTTGILNVAGVEPTGAALFSLQARDGQLDGPTMLRVCRDTSDTQSDTAIDWVTGAPAVVAMTIG